MSVAPLLRAALVGGREFSMVASASSVLTLLPVCQGKLCHPAQRMPSIPFQIAICPHCAGKQSLDTLLGLPERRWIFPHGKKPGTPPARSF